jgi:hypothetical protein
MNNHDLTADLADQTAIGELTARYNRAFDERRFADWAATFTPDGVLAVADGPATAGREALEQIASGSVTITFHVTTNAVIRVDGDTATQELQLLVLTCEAGRGEMTIMAFGRYADELVRSSEGWRFKRRTATMQPAAVPGPTERPL